MEKVALKLPRLNPFNHLLQRNLLNELVQHDNRMLDFLRVLNYKMNVYTS